MNHNRQADIQRNLYFRAAVISAIREFFTQHDYLEVETPLRIPAPAPEVHIDAVASEDWFLHTSPELSMKRLLSAGYARIFQMCKCFRRGERGKKHLPEFTVLEWYAADADYRDMMDETENLLCHVAQSINSGDVIHYQGQRINFKKPWQRISVDEAFKNYASVSLKKAMVENIFEEIMTEEIEPFLGKNQPVFLYDYPVEMAALARKKPDDPRYAERFELYIGGIEICNAFSELTDGTEQRERFKTDSDLRRAMGKTAYPEPGPFLKALPQMPDASGNALGVDRLVMLLADLKAIDDVVSFTPEEL